MSGINGIETETEFNHASDLFPLDILCFVTSGNLAYRHDAEFIYIMLKLQTHITESEYRLIGGGSPNDFVLRCHLPHKFCEGIHLVNNGRRILEYYQASTTYSCRVPTYICEQRLKMGQSCSSSSARPTRGHNLSISQYPLRSGGGGGRSSLFDRSQARFPMIILPARKMYKLDSALSANTS